MFLFLNQFDPHHLLFPEEVCCVLLDRGPGVLFGLPVREEAADGQGGHQKHIEAWGDKSQSVRGAKCM